MSNATTPRGRRRFVASMTRCVERLPARRRPARRGLSLFQAFDLLEERALLSGTITTVHITVAGDSGTSGSKTLRDYVQNQANADANTADSFVYILDTPVTLQSTLPLHANITIESGSSTQLNGPGTNATITLLQVASGKTVTLSGLDIEHGNGDQQGGAVDNSGTLSITNCTLKNNAAINGGAVYNENGGSLTVDGGTVISFDSAVDDGAGIYNASGGTVFVQGGSQINSNTASGNGGGVLNKGTLTIQGASQLNSNGARNGGGLYNQSNSAALIGATFHANTAANTASAAFTNNNSTAAPIMNVGNGGGIWNGGTLNVWGATSTFTNNSASNSGNGALTLDSNGNYTAASVSICGDGGGIYNQGTLTVASGGALSMTSNSATNTGSVSFSNPNNVTVKATQVPNPGTVLTNSGNGGGVYNAIDATATIASSSFTSNTASNGGSGYTNSTSNVPPKPPLLIAPVFFSGNGGAIFNDGGNAQNNGDSGSLSVSSSTFSMNGAGNTAGAATTQTSGNGGGLFNFLDGQVTATGNSFSSGTASSNGAGLLNTGSLTVSGGTISGNVAGNAGGGLYNAGALTVTNVAITGNSAIQGGGVENIGGTSTSNVTVPAVATVSGSTLSGNTASDGAGFKNFGATAYLFNTTIAGNTASGTETGTGIVPTAGGLVNEGPAVLQAQTPVNSHVYLRNVTVANNSVTSSSDIAANQTGSQIFSGDVPAGQPNVVFGTIDISLGNTVLAGDPAGGPVALAFNGATLTSAGHNISTDASGGLSASGDLPSTNPLLTTLGNYGGATQTLALLPGSPAIDGGSNALAVNPSNSASLTTDQRGDLRKVNGTADIGAFESRGFTITPISGGGQSAQVATAFGQALVAQVSSAFGEPVQGGAVTFSGPAAGASASFSGDAATIGAAGLATSVLPIANTHAGSYNATASASGITSAATFSLTNNPGPAAAISASSGTPQIGAFNTSFASALQALVVDQYNNPVPNVSVTFAAPGTAPSGAFSGSATVSTNASGIATAPTFTADATAGTYVVTASVAGVTPAAQFSLANAPTLPTSVSALAGSPQNVTVGSAPGTELQAKVIDASQNPVAGVVVTFTVNVSSTTGSFNGLATTTATTDAQGIATVVDFTAGTLVGSSYTVSASVVGIGSLANFSLKNVAGSPTQINPITGTPQTVGVLTAIGTSLEARVEDQFGNPVSAVSVTFTAPGSGASGTFSNNTNSVAETTDANGDVTAPAFTADSTSGSYAVVASFTSGSSTVSTAFNLTNQAGLPSSIIASAGTPQSVGVLGALATPLQATVTDGLGNPVPGVSVTFAAPGSGASGTFTGNLTTAMVLTNAQGVATAPTFTANGIKGNYTITASVSGVSPSAQFSITNTAGLASKIVIVSGSFQSTTVETAFASSLVAEAEDALGNAVQGASVTFNLPLPGPGGTFGGLATQTVITGSNGLASVTFTANKLTGSYPVNATIVDTQGHKVSAGFFLTNTPDLPALILPVAGDSQAAPVTTAFATALQARVTDQFGNPEPAGVTVTFTAPSTGATGTFANGTHADVETTDSQGMVTATAFTANTVAGAYVVTASSTANNVTSFAQFKLTNSAGTPTTLLATAGAAQSAVVNTAFAMALKAQVFDVFNNPVPGVVVTFTAPGSEPTGTFGFNGATATATTDSTGTATAPPLTAGHLVGSFQVSASVSGVPNKVLYNLTNTPGAPASIAATAGTPQSAVVGTAFTTPFQVVVKDQFGNVVPGATVTFAAPTTSGPSGTFTSTPTTTTDSHGLASAPTFTANTLKGTYTVTATVGSTFLSTSFSLTNTPNVATGIAPTAGSGQSIAVGSAFKTPLQVLVTDVLGHPVAGVTVTFAAPASGASGTFSSSTSTSVSTNAQGVATAPTLYANHMVGTYTVNASVAGVSTPAAFSLTNTPGTPSKVTAVGGTPQSASINSAFATPLQVSVTDQFGNPVPNAAVQFSAPTFGASGTFSGSATATTNAQGLASVGFTANSKLGNYTVTATASGTFTSANFSLTNTAGPPANIVVSSGSGQIATVNTVFSSSLRVQVKDAGGNPVAGASVTFTAPSTGPGGTFSGNATVTTDSQGFATAPSFRANTAAGGFSVTASVAGVSTPVSFSLANRPGYPTIVAPLTGTPQSAPINSVFTIPLAAKVTDAYGNPVAGVYVSFSAPYYGPRALFNGNSYAYVSTNLQGIATAPVVSASGAAGTYTVTATAGGIYPPAKFVLTNLAAAPHPAPLLHSSTATVAGAGAVLGHPKGVLAFFKPGSRHHHLTH